MLDMGVEDYLLTSTVNGILAQRPVRYLEPTHAEKYPPAGGNDQSSACAASSRTAKSSCTARAFPLAPTGYLGRTTIMEFLVMDDELRAR